MLNPYIFPSNLFRLIIYEKIINHFRLLFSDPNVVNSSKAKFEKLLMFFINEFYIFCAKFIKFAGFSETLTI
jgi:hypothetical protein